jgi:hypothetical protein
MTVNRGDGTLSMLSPRCELAPCLDVIAGGPGGVGRGDDVAAARGSVPSVKLAPRAVRDVARRVGNGHCCIAPSLCASGHDHFEIRLVI